MSLNNNLNLSVEMTTVEEIPTINMLVVPDNQFTRLLEILNESPVNETFITNREGVRHRFTLENDEVFAEVEKEGKTIKQKVINETEGSKIKQEHTTSFKESLRQRIRSDFPDMSEEQLEQDVDILNEANESIKALIKQGVPPEVAKSIIFTVLDNGSKIQSESDLENMVVEKMKEIEESERIVA